MSDKIYFSKLSDPEKWDADLGEPVATFETPEEAQNAARLANEGKLTFLSLWKRLRETVPEEQRRD